MDLFEWIADHDFLELGCKNIFITSEGVAGFESLFSASKFFLDLSPSSIYDELNLKKYSAGFVEGQKDLGKNQEKCEHDPELHLFFVKCTFPFLLA